MFVKDSYTAEGQGSMHEFNTTYIGLELFGRPIPLVNNVNRERNFGSYIPNI